MNLFAKIHIGKHKFPSAISAFITLILIAGALVGVILFITPLIGQIAAEMGAINFDELNQKLSVPLWRYNNMLYEFFPTMDRNLTIESMVMEQLRGVLNLNVFSTAFTSVTNFIIHLGICAFTIVFVTFFFLKDSDAFAEMVLLFVPTKYELNTRRALDNVNRLLIRYFGGITIEMFLITILNTTGLHFIGGLEFQLAVVLAFLSAIFNIIPYVGPVVAGLFGTAMGVLAHYTTGADPDMLGLIIRFVCIFLFTHLCDVSIFQPFIYSNSVKAHPLEIFLVIIIAGHIGGIIGMLVAIPAYTVIRVFAKEFLYRFKIVQKMTEKMN